jgi:non-ribosomal peptide synthetase component E (peptide arylation enzyme)
VREVAVIALPDARTGERACAVVVPTSLGDAPQLAELTDHLQSTGLSDRKFPEQLVLVDELPRNAMGKVVKTALKERVEAMR